MSSNSVPSPENHKPKKNRKGLKIAGGVVAGILLIAGCNTVTNDGDENNSSPSSPVESESKNGLGDQPRNTEEEFTPTYPGATKDDVAVNGGETVTLDNGIEITTTPVTIVPGLLDDSYLCTTVTYVNGSDKDASLTDFDFGLQTANGQVLTPTIPMVDGSEPLYSTELLPGGTATGDLCFENSSSVPSGEAQLVYDPTFSWSTQRGVWLNVI